MGSWTRVTPSVICCPHRAPRRRERRVYAEALVTLTAATPDFEKLVKAAVLSMPAAKHLGFDFGRVAPGEAEIVQPYRKELTEHNGFFQAGVVGALADFAGGSAGWTLLAPGWVPMTVDYTVKLLAPAKAEKIV